MRPSLGLSSFESFAFLDFLVKAFIAGDCQMSLTLDCLLNLRDGLAQLLHQHLCDCVVAGESSVDVSLLHAATMGQARVTALNTVATDKRSRRFWQR